MYNVFICTKNITTKFHSLFCLLLIKVLYIHRSCRDVVNNVQIKPGFEGTMLPRKCNVQVGVLIYYRI